MTSWWINSPNESMIALQLVWKAQTPGQPKQHFRQWCLHWIRPKHIHTFLFSLPPSHTHLHTHTHTNVREAGLGQTPRAIGQCTTLKCFILRATHQEASDKCWCCYCYRCSILALSKHTGRLITPAEATQTTMERERERSLRYCTP